MKEYDYVKLLVEKEKYAKDGVHKDMIGWICDPRVIYNQRLVSFETEDGEEIACISVKEEDLEVFWEAPVEQVGVNVILLSDEYQKTGFKKGLKGVICKKGEKDNQWVVLFEKQEGLQQESRLVVDEDDIAII